MDDSKRLAYIDAGLVAHVPARVRHPLVGVVGKHGDQAVAELLDLLAKAATSEEVEPDELDVMMRRLKQLAAPGVVEALRPALAKILELTPLQRRDLRETMVLMKKERRAEANTREGGNRLERRRRKAMARKAR